MMNAATGSVMDQLREQTLEAHKSAESHPFQRDMASGRLPREKFVTNLGQLLLLHRQLDECLRHAANSNPAFARVLRDHQYQTPYLMTDLMFFMVDAGTLRALPATERAIEAIRQAAETNPLALLGMHYVLEGSKNGSKFVCRAVLRAYGLAPGAGTKYMDPYGDRQREYWAAFKADMNSAEFTQSQIDSLIGAARTMFAAIEGIGEDILKDG